MSILTDKKQCSRCKLEKNRSEFNKCKTRHDGLNGYCKICSRAINNAYIERVKERNKEEGIDLTGKKFCPYCGRDKPKDRFGLNYSRRDGINYHCKSCTYKLRKGYLQEYKKRDRYKKQQKEYKHSPRGKEVEAKYRRTDGRKRALDKYNKSDKRKIVSIRYFHRRRLLIEENGGDFTEEEWKSLCNKYNNICLCCGEKTKLTIDHVIPITLGGKNDITNLQPLCRSCNTKKKQKSIDFRENYDNDFSSCG